MQEYHFIPYSVQSFLISLSVFIPYWKQAYLDII
jgi:hypothetical protein